VGCELCRTEARNGLLTRAFRQGHVERSRVRLGMMVRPPPHPLRMNWEKRRVRLGHKAQENSSDRRSDITRYNRPLETQM